MRGFEIRFDLRKICCNWVQQYNREIRQPQSGSHISFGMSKFGNYFMNTFFFWINLDLIILSSFSLLMKTQIPNSISVSVNNSFHKTSKKFHTFQWFVGVPRSFKNNLSTYWSTDKGSLFYIFFYCKLLNNSSPIFYYCAGILWNNYKNMFNFFEL